MGYTQFDCDLIKKYLTKDIKSVVDLGSQNLYLKGEEKPPFASEWYKENGIYNYCCIDLAGDNHAIKANLSKPIELTDDPLPLLHPELNRKVLFDLVVDAGTSEHIVVTDKYKTIPFHDGHINSVYPNNEIIDVGDIKKGYYNCWMNKHNLLKYGGLMISINPMTGNWPLHGYSYLGIDFYVELCNNSTYSLIETGIQGGSGNWETGINVFGVIRKNSDDFISYHEFNKLSIFRS